jgi:hypothetical protein
MTNLTKALLIAASSHRYVSDSPFTCNIFSHGLLRSERCHAPEGDGPGGGGDPPAKLSLTQAEIDSMIGKRLAEERKKFDGHDDFKAQAAKAKEFEAELTKLREEKELEGKSQAEKDRIAGEKAKQAIERERSEFGVKLTAAEKARDEAVGSLRSYIVNNALSTGLVAAKVLPQAAESATKLFSSAAQVELDDNRNVTSVIYAGVTHKTVAEAAAAFLKDNNFLAAAPTVGGGGTKQPNGSGGGTNGRALHEMSEDELLRQASTAR